MSNVVDHSISSLFLPFVEAQLFGEHQFALAKAEVANNTVSTVVAAATLRNKVLVKDALCALMISSFFAE